MASGSVTPWLTSIAAAPATCGVAMDVPLKAGYRSHLPLPPLQIVCWTTSTPGAAISTCGPRDENVAILSSRLLALTPMTPSDPPG
jgi:hypothetical protein